MLVAEEKKYNTIKITKIFTQFTKAARLSPAPQRAALTCALMGQEAQGPKDPAKDCTGACVAYRPLEGTSRSSAASLLVGVDSWRILFWRPASECASLNSATPAPIWCSILKDCAKNPSCAACRKASPRCWVPCPRIRNPRSCTHCAAFAPCRTSDSLPRRTNAAGKKMGRASCIRWACSRWAFGTCLGRRLAGPPKRRSA